MKILWFCAAGYSFFIGTSLLIAAILLSLFRRKPWSKIIVYAFFISGVSSIFLSGTPFPLWFYIIWAITLIPWLVLINVKLSREKLKPLTISSLAPLFLCMISIPVELPYHFKPSIPKEDFEKLYVIGDSVSAGIGGQNEQTWPKILQRKYKINLVNLSESGATVASALSQAAKIDSKNAIVLLEIGGNDLFAPTPTSIFEKNMRELLQTISVHNITVVIMELPLQPWNISYGRIQRKLAKEFGAILIPKRFFVSVLSKKGASTDLAHLSSRGHELMAERIWYLLGKSLSQTTNTISESPPSL